MRSKLNFYQVLFMKGKADNKLNAASSTLPQIKCILRLELPLALHKCHTHLENYSRERDVIQVPASSEVLKGKSSGNELALAITATLLCQGLSSEPGSSRNGWQTYISIPSTSEPERWGPHHHFISPVPPGDTLCAKPSSMP